MKGDDGARAFGKNQRFLFFIHGAKPSLWKMKWKMTRNIFCRLERFNYYARLTGWSMRALFFAMTVERVDEK